MARIWFDADFANARRTTAADDNSVMLAGALPCWARFSRVRCLGASPG